MFRKLSRIFFVVFIIATIFTGTVSAANYAEAVGDIVTTKSVSPEPFIYAQYGLLIDSTTGTIIYEKKADEKVYPASTTKIMTLILALESGLPFNKKITISEEAADVGGSSAYLQRNDVISFQDLLYGMMLNSGNDAAYAVGEAVAGNVEDFVDMMNEKAQELGLTNTHFVNPHGIHDPE
ncbi:MAG TPA: serine hydrolase, partial [Clostridia bacterium]|nr:serine hydrolase [Clostridia bacterium]